jgi:hypothetical protein
VGRSVSALNLARTDLDRLQSDYSTTGAQLQAIAAVVRTGQTGPFHWTSATDAGFVDVLVEKEANKLTLQAASQLSPDALGRFGVTDAADLQGRLAAAAGGADVVDVAGLDAAPLWRLCAARLVSTFGQQDAFIWQADATPDVGTKPAWWRVAEVWRVRVTTAAGWRDDRIVRFTGDASHPAAVVARSVSRGEGDGGRCDDVLKSIGAV